MFGRKKAALSVPSSLGELSSIIDIVQGNTTLREMRDEIMRENSERTRVLLDAEQRFGGLRDVAQPETPIEGGMLGYAYDYVSLLTRGSVLSDKEFKKAVPETGVSAKNG